MSPLAGIKNFLGNNTQMSSATIDPNPPAYPTIPTTLNTGDHELRDWSEYRNRDEGHAYTDSQYTPYLGLRARLSQTWINKWTILLLLVLFRVLLAVRNLDTNIDSAQREALSACTSVENVGSAMASMPHYLSAGVNSLAADGITSTVHGLKSMLMLTLTGVEEIVLFIINMMTSTYSCLITLVVTGSISAAIDMIEEVGSFMNKTIQGLTAEVSNDISSFTGTLNDFLGDLGSIASKLGASSSPPTLDVSGVLNKLNGIQVDPTQMDADLEKLRANLPNFSQVQNFTNGIISFPFEEVKKLVNESLGVYTFDKSLFKIAPKQALTFCSDNSTISDFFKGLAEVAAKAKQIFIAFMCVAAVLACIPMAYREIWRYRTMIQRSQLLKDQAFDPIDVMYIASRPYTSTAGIKVAQRFTSTKRQLLVRWAVAYATSIPALFVLALGVAGLFSALCQFILLKAVEKEVPIIAAEVGNFTGTVVAALTNASESWADSANSVILSTQTDINHDLLGWVNTTTGAVNNTLNIFVDEMNSILNSTFGGTVLYNPIKETLNCLIGLKIAGIEKGLTWVSDNAVVNLPKFNTDLFSLGAVASLSNSSSDDAFLSSPASTTTDDITGAIAKLTTIMAAGIREEALVALALVMIWVLIALIGIITALIGFYSRDKTRGEGGGPATRREERTPLTPRDPVRNMAATFPEFGSVPAYPNAGYPYTVHEDPWDVLGPERDQKLGGGEAVARSIGLQAEASGTWAHEKNVI